MGVEFFTRIINSILGSRVCEIHGFYSVPGISISTGIGSENKTPVTMERHTEHMQV
jgi:hypothetical protein